MGPTRRLTADEIAARKQQEVLEKDETEIALEKALFGDSAGFLSSLDRTAQAGDGALTRIAGGRELEEGMENGLHDEDMQDIADEDLFFLDAGTADLPDDVMDDLRTEQHEVQEDKDRQRSKVLWYDSDDERITVSLASNTRLRKLRDTEADDIVTGLEYIRRLRRQYERLHPTPEWVKYARKKRKITKGDDEQSDSDSDVSVDAPSVTPLAEVLRSAASLTRADANKLRTTSSHALRLRPEVIDIQRMKDIASSGPSSIDTLQFHPSFPLILTAGPSSTVNLYHLSPSSQNPNPALTSLHVKGTPVTTALFAQPQQSPSSTPETSPDTRIYISGRRRYFHAWSLTTGTLTKVSRPLYQSGSLATGPAASLAKKSRKNQELPTCERLVISRDAQYLAIISNTGSSGGVIHILNATTHQPVSQVRIDSLNGIADAVFYRDSSGLSIVGKNGEISEYNIPEGRVTARWTDEGAVGTTTLALGGEIRDPRSSAGTDMMGSDRFVAIGSTSGIVNIYDRIQITQHFAKSLSQEQMKQDAVSYRPKPLRSLDNLTTPISHLHFSSEATGQLLVMASRWKKNALRLVHLPSCTVYKNWPTDKTPLGRISSVAISPDGGYLAVGNEAGKVRLWQIRD